MAREQFFDSLRFASQMLPDSEPRDEYGPRSTDVLFAKIEAANLWLTPKSVKGFDPADFADQPKTEKEKLQKEVKAFLAIAEKVSANKPASKIQSKAARKHIERAIQIVGSRLVHEWVEAQDKMLEVAKAAAASKGWYAQKDEKEVRESLLGTYKAPRLRIKSLDREVVFDPIARFCAGQRGVVDLVHLTTYETVYLVTFKDGQWQIVSMGGSAHSRPFTPATLLNTISKLPTI